MSRVHWVSQGSGLQLHVCLLVNWPSPIIYSSLFFSSMQVTDASDLICWGALAWETGYLTSGLAVASHKAVEPPCAVSPGVKEA